MVLKKTVRKINDIYCNDYGISMGTCKKSLECKGNYPLIILYALFFQYLLPMIFFMVAIPLILGNLIVVGIVEILQLFNPFFMIVYIPLSFVDAVVIGVSLFFAIAIIIIYWTSMHKELGIHLFLPFGMWILSVIIYWIPLAGPVFSLLLGSFPWILVGMFIHGWSCSDSK